MKTATVLLVCLLLAAGVAPAKDNLKRLRSEEHTTVEGRFGCATPCYEVHTWPAGTFVPDDDPAGVTIGPLSTASGATILDVILRMDITHTWVGDLIVELWYDEDCDGTPETLGGVLCRPGLAGCPTDDCCGCSGDLFGWYGFDDAVESIEDNCFAEFPPGCYGPDYDSAGLDVFDGLPTGGCFWLHVVDGAGGDLGQVRRWEVHVLTGAYTDECLAFDIKPGSCPNPLNVNSHGVLPAAFLGTGEFDVTLIDPDSILLLGTVEPLEWNYEDVATPVGPDAEECECNELGPDGHGDLTVTFAKQEVVAALGTYEDGDVISVPVAAELHDGTPVELSDCVWIVDNNRDGLRTALQAPGTGAISKESAEQATWGTIKALYR